MRTEWRLRVGEMGDVLNGNQLYIGFLTFLQPIYDNNSGHFKQIMTATSSLLDIAILGDISLLP